MRKRTIQIFTQGPKEVKYLESTQSFAYESFDKWCYSKTCQKMPNMRVRQDCSVVYGLQVQLWPRKTTGAELVAVDCWLLMSDLFCPFFFQFCQVADVRWAGCVFTCRALMSLLNYFHTNLVIYDMDPQHSAKNGLRGMVCDIFPLVLFYQLAACSMNNAPIAIHWVWNTLACPRRLIL